MEFIQLFLSLSRLRSEHGIFLFFHLFFLTLLLSYVGSPCSKTLWLFLVPQWWCCKLTNFTWAANPDYVYGGFIDILHCRGAMMFSIMFSIMRISINSIQHKWHTTYKTLNKTVIMLCIAFLIVVLNVIILSVFMLDVTMRGTTVGAWHTNTPF